MIPARALLVVTLLAGCATTPTAYSVADLPLGWVCQRKFSEAGGHLWINKIMSPNGEHKEYSVGWRAFASVEPSTGGADIFWTVPTVGGWFSKLDHAEFDFAFDRQLSGPITASLYLDGEVVQQEVVLDQRWARRFQKSARWGGTVQVVSPSSSATKLHGAETATVIVTGPEDRQIAVVKMPLPNWKVADELINEAIPALDKDALVRETKCERESGPEI